jgi:DNA-directed RNA polymerase subunit H
LKAIKDLGFAPSSLPKIFVDDPSIRRMNPEAGDIVMIIRSSPTAGKLVIYRLVVER